MAKTKTVKKKKRISPEQRKKNLLTAALIIVAVLLLVMIMALAINKANDVSKEDLYKQAEDYLTEGKVSRAVNIFRDLGDYKDAATRIKALGIEYAGFEDAIFMSSEDTPAYSINDGGVLSFNGKEYKFTNGIPTIPDVLDGKKVTSLANGFFSSADWLTEVTIPRNVTVIPPSAFRTCKNLKKVTFHNKLTTISNDAFFQCTSLESVEFPESLSVIGASAFYGCTALKEITVPKGVAEIPEAAFQHCTGLESANLEGVLYLRNHSLADCTALCDITLGANLQIIEVGCLDYCLSLNKVTFRGTSDRFEALIPSVGSTAEILKNAEKDYN